MHRANSSTLLPVGGGNTHDETMFLNSYIFGRFQNGEFVHNGRDSILLGDGGYRAERYLVTPLRETQQRRSAAEILYQRTHIATRNCVERIFGQWKKRFPCLWLGMRFRKLETVLNIIVATAVLHNICKQFHDLLPPPLTSAENEMFDAAMNQERAFVNARNNVQRAARPAGIKHTLLRHYFENIAAQQ